LPILDPARPQEVRLRNCETIAPRLVLREIDDLIFRKTIALHAVVFVLVQQAGLGALSKPVQINLQRSDCDGRPLLLS
jgi:hypothetical protein